MSNSTRLLVHTMPNQDCDSGKAVKDQMPWNLALPFLFLYDRWNHCFVKDWSSCQSSTHINNDYINLLCRQLHLKPPWLRKWLWICICIHLCSMRGHKVTKSLECQSWDPCMCSSRPVMEAGVGCVQSCGKYAESYTIFVLTIQDCIDFAA